MDRLDYGLEKERQGTQCGPYGEVHQSFIGRCASVSVDDKARTIKGAYGQLRLGGLIFPGLTDMPQECTSFAAFAL